jgi:hypothetical protein
MVFLHSVPLLTSGANMLLTKGYLFHQHGSYMLYFGPAYMCINAFGSWQRGLALYPFMDWLNSPIRAFITGIIMFVTGIYMFRGACTLINNKVKRNNRPKEWGLGSKKE